MKRGYLAGVLVAVTTMVTGLGATAMAGAPNPLERAGDRRELREDRRELGADVWDKAYLEALLADYARARAARNVAALRELDQRFMAEIRVEVRETRVETTEKAAELRDSKIERGGERREVVKDVVKGHPLKAARDSKDLRDDRRDVRGDRRDLAAESASLARKREIAEAYTARLGQFDAGAVAAKEGLIRRAVQEASLEVKADLKEKAEDRRELREDRRDERRPD